ncbi:tetratricopeptide repeat protein [Aquicoccus sp. SCR17]|nr:tetratricopeptide repeat protein [Carideicomes alvinocaridis]
MSNPQADARKIADLLNGGQFRAAFKAARGAMKKYPREAFFANMAGIAQGQTGNHREAIPLFQKAMKLNPGFADAGHNLIRALVSSGRLREAGNAADTLLKRHADDPELWYLRGLVANAAGDTQGCEAALDRAARLSPRDHRIPLLRGTALFEGGYSAAAVAALEEARQLAPRDPETLVQLSQPLGHLNRHDEALEAVEAALAAAPTDLDALRRRAVLLNEMGRGDEARAAWTAALEAAPEDVPALCALVSLQRGEANAALQPRLRALHDRLPKGHPDRVELAFALARIADQQGDAAAMAEWLAEANAADARLRPFSIPEARAEFDRITAAFPVGGPLPDPAPTDSTLPRPIFVLGMMRSGTTLCEQILSAHPEVYGAGERNASARILGRHTHEGTPFDREAAADFAQAYRAELPDMPAGTRAFVDKMPANYRLIGYLLTAFPEAVIIHMARDPRDVALSIWRNRFPAGALAFTADQAALAEVTNLYRRYMNHWHAAFPGRVHDLTYEGLVADVESGSRQLAEWAGLDWVEDMAAPERNRGAVRTASVNQVREGVHSRSVASWRKHREMMAPFLAGLDPALWPDLEV